MDGRAPRGVPEPPPPRRRRDREQHERARTRRAAEDDRRERRAAEWPAPPGGAVGAPGPAPRRVGPEPASVHRVLDALTTSAARQVARVARRRRLAPRAGPRRRRRARNRALAAADGDHAATRRRSDAFPHGVGPRFANGRDSCRLGVEPSAFAGLRLRVEQALGSKARPRCLEPEAHRHHEPNR